MATSRSSSLLIVAALGLLVLSSHLRHSYSSQAANPARADLAPADLAPTDLAPGDPEDELSDLDHADARGGLHREPRDDEESEELEDYDDDQESAADGDAHPGQGAAIDDKDVVVLTRQNFSAALAENHFVMVEFFAPWCGHCQALAPEYAKASAELKGDVVLAKVDATVEHELAQHYGVQGYPTLFFFVDGVAKPYSGHRTGDEIVKWIKRKIGPSVTNISAVSDAEALLDADGPVAVAFLEDLEGKEAEEYASAARQDDQVLFYQTKDPDVVAVLPFKEGSVAPGVVLLKKAAERVSQFEGNFERSEITEFVFENKLPLVISFSKENSTLIFESSVRKQILLFASPVEAASLYPLFEEASKSFKGKALFVYVDTSNSELAFPVLDFFGISAEKAAIMGFVAVENGNKYMLEGDITLESIKEFGEGFLSETLKPFLKSDPIPEKNDGDVKIVVGKNFEEIVLDESKDVLLEIYAPWCGHCQALEPIYNKLAERLRGIDSLVIAKMDGTSNEHTRSKADGFPTLLFYPAGRKSFDPISADVDRNAKALYRFIKKHAAIPFTLPKRNKSTEANLNDIPSQNLDVEKAVEDPPKDEL